MRALFFLLILFICSFAKGQKMPVDYFNEGIQDFKYRQFDKALKCFKYITYHYPNNVLYPKALYNIGCIYFEQMKYDKAITVFKSILNPGFEVSKYNNGTIEDYGCNDYKHLACVILSDIYFHKKKFERSLYYFSLSDTLYTETEGCEDYRTPYVIRAALRYADIYRMLNQEEKAIEKLLPLVFLEDIEEYGVMEVLHELLKGRKDLKPQLDSAINNLNIMISNNVEYPNSRYYFTFLGVEIRYPYYPDERDDGLKKEDALREIQWSAFYKMIGKL